MFHIVLIALFALSAPVQQAQQPSDRTTTIQVMSLGKAVATLIIPKGQATVTVSGDRISFDKSQLATIAGKATVKLTRDKEQLFKLEADEITVRESAPAPQGAK